jgi:hypothetical protein
MQGLGNWLGRVEAPPELWDRVRNSQAEACATSTPKWPRLQPVFLVGPLVLAAVVLLLALFPRDLHSSDPSQIHAWVLAKTGISVPLPEKLAPTVRLISASRRDKSTAQIAYQVDGQDAILLISMATAAVAGDGKHRALNRTASRTANSSSWTMRGVVYTVFCPSAEVSQVACRLCHSL